MGSKYKDAQARQAFREKIASCVIIGILMIMVAYFTFGLQLSLCPDDGAIPSADAALNQSDHVSIPYRDEVIISGYLYDFNDTAKLLATKAGITLTADWHGADITGLFKPPRDQCQQYTQQPPKSCTVQNKYGGQLSAGTCAEFSWLDSLHATGRNFFSWNDVAMNTAPPNVLTVFNGMVLNLTNYYLIPPASRFSSYDSNIARIIDRSVGVDGTYTFVSSYESIAAAYCLQQTYMVGFVDKESVGCTATRFIQSLALAVILCLILTRFLMAVAFHWFISEQIVKPRAQYGGGLRRYHHRTHTHRAPPSEMDIPQYLPDGSENPAAVLAVRPIGRRQATEEDPYCILLVTCYNEDRQGIRNTLESLAVTTYPDSRKQLFGIDEGFINGAEPKPEEKKAANEK
ncbi:hypothetical protein HDU76_010854, partial [Blyttiomyces sp. JEL0837]